MTDRISLCIGTTYTPVRDSASKGSFQAVRLLAEPRKRWPKSGLWVAVILTMGSREHGVHVDIREGSGYAFVDNPPPRLFTA